VGYGTNIENVLWITHHSFVDKWITFAIFMHKYAYLYKNL